MRNTILILEDEEFQFYLLGIPEENNSPFCESIIDIMSNNTDPKFNVAKLAYQVVKLTRANYSQLPEGAPMFGVGDKGGQYIFQKKIDKNEIIFAKGLGYTNIETKNPISANTMFHLNLHQSNHM